MPDADRKRAQFRVNTSAYAATLCLATSVLALSSSPALAREKADWRGPDRAEAARLDAQATARLGARAAARLTARRSASIDQPAQRAAANAGPRVQPTPPAPAPIQMAQNLPRPMPAQNPPVTAPQPAAPPQVPSAQPEVSGPNPSVASRANRYNPTSRVITLPVPLIDGARELGEVRLTIGTDDSLEINAQDFLTSITPVIDPRALQELQSLIGGQQRATLAVLKSAGYDLIYSPETLQLKVSIPSQSRTVRNLKIADLDREPIGEFQAPEKASGYVNIRTNLDYVSKGLETGLIAPQFFLDGAARFGDVVFETEGSYQTNPTTGSAFRRQGSRFVYDDLKRTIRWTVGDLRAPTRGFQSSGGVAGVSFLRSYAQLDPQKNIRPRGDRSFTLLRPSTVETLINNQSINRLRLDPGTYNVSDFPFVQGSNDVRLVIKDDVGTSESIEFNLFFDRSLLQPGTAEFGGFAGIAAPFGDSQPDYNSDVYVVSGFYRRGISQFLTAGVNAQFDDVTQVLGTEFLISSPIGTIGFDVAASNRDGVGSGQALNFSYSNQFQGDGEAQGHSQSFSITGEYRSENFATLGSSTVTNPIAFQIGASYSRSLSEFAFLVLDTRYAVGRGTQSDTQNYRVSYGQRIGALFSLTLDALYVKTEAADNTVLRISLTRRFGERTSARADYDTNSNRARLALQTSRGSGVGAVSLSGDLDVGDGRYGLNGNASYTGNRAEFGLSHTTAFLNNSSISDQRTSLRIGTAIAVAGGQIAFGRPISDGFAIVVPHPSIRNEIVELDPREGRYEARSGPMGGAVATGLASFSERTISFDVPNAPSGYDLGTGNIRVRPPYRAGYLAVVGSDYSKSALGRLLDRQGAPISFVAGQATEEANPERPPITVFTNREGRFAIAGLRAGRWKIVFTGETEATYSVTIPAGEESIIRLGDVKPTDN